MIQFDGRIDGVGEKPPTRKENHQSFQQIKVESINPMVSHEKKDPWLVV